MRAILDGSGHMERKKRSIERLSARYYGKLDLLAAWEDHPNPDMDYIRDLKARLRTHKNNLLYKGVYTDELRDKD